MSSMPKIFQQELSEYTYPLSRGSFLRILALAAANGVIIWLLALAFDRMMLTPVFCSSADQASMCVNSAAWSSYIALVLVGIMMVPLLIMFGVKRPLVVVIAATIALWGTNLWTSGLWTTSILWTIAASALVYLAVIWINRIRGNAAAILFVAIFVLLARVVLSL